MKREEWKSREGQTEIWPGEEEGELPLQVLEHSLQLGTLPCISLSITDGLWRWEGVGRGRSQITCERPSMAQPQTVSIGTTWHLG
jgi:hypothetical protein